MQTNTDTII